MRSDWKVECFNGDGRRPLPLTFSRNQEITTHKKWRWEELLDLTLWGIEGCKSPLRTSAVKQQRGPNYLRMAWNCSGTSQPGFVTFLGNVWQPGTGSWESKWWYLPILGGWNSSSGARECENLIKWLTLVSRLVRQANEARKGTDELRQ